MVYDICVKIKGIGEVCGNYVKSTKNSIYLKNALLSKSSGVVVALFKIEKKFVVSISRMGLPLFESFSDFELKAISDLNNPDYNEKIQEILKSRGVTNLSVESTKNVVENNLNGINSLDQSLKSSSLTKLKKSKKEWNQLAANDELYGVPPEFDMNDYSIRIDRTAVGYKELEEKSIKIAQEIMAQETTDIHRLEERGTTNGIICDDILYSTVSLDNKWEEVEANPATSCDSLNNNIPQIRQEKDSILLELGELGNLSISYQNDSNKDAWTDVAIKILSKRRMLEKKLKDLDEEALKAEKEDRNSKLGEDLNSQDLSKGKDTSMSRKGISNSVNGSFSNTQSEASNMHRSVSPRSGKIQPRQMFKRSSESVKANDFDHKPLKQIIAGAEIPEFANVHEYVNAIQNSFINHRSNDENKKWSLGGSVTINSLYASISKHDNKMHIPQERLECIQDLVRKDLDLQSQKKTRVSS